jgi:hypothetical protein
MSPPLGIVASTVMRLRLRRRSIFTFSPGW